MKRSTLDIEPAAHADQLQKNVVEEIFVKKADRNKMRNGYALNIFSKATTLGDVSANAYGIFTFAYC